MKKLEALLEWGGVRKDIILLVLSGAALLVSILWGDPSLTTWTPTERFSFGLLDLAKRRGW